VHDTIETPGVITTALSKETELGMNGIEKVNNENDGTVAGSWGTLTTRVRRALQEGLSCHCVDAACV